MVIPAGQLPTRSQKNALVGTNGTPDTGDPFVTNSDPRLGGGSQPFGNWLSTTTGINGKTVAFTTLFTVPALKSCFVSALVIRPTVATAITVAPTIGLRDATGPVTIYTPQALFGLTTATTSFSFVSQGIIPIAAAADLIQLNITVGATGTTLTLTVDLFG